MGLIGSPRAYVVGRFISAVAGFGYSGRGKRPSSRETVLHPSHFCKAIPLYEGNLGNGLSPPPTQQRLKPLAAGLWADPVNVGDVAFVLKSSRNAEVVFTPLETEP